MALRRQICERFIREPGYRFVELPDPPRAKDGDYRQAVADWHAARARVWAEAIESELAPGGVGAFLAWGDPSLYDSTLRILDTVAARVDIDYDVIPGITAIQALTARHRIPLNDVGEPVLDHHRPAAARQRAVRQRRGDARRRLLVSGAARRQTRIWWGAYLGTPDELLVAGTVGEVGEQIAERARRGARPARLDHGHLPAATRRLTVRRGKINGMGSFLLRAALTGVRAVGGHPDRSRHQFRRRGHHTGRGSGIVFVVAVIFGLVNAIIKPIVQIISIPLYILTLGLIHIVINALMLWITSWITEHTTHWGLYIDDFWWTAIWAAIVLSIVSWLLSLVTRDAGRRVRT